MQYRNITYGEFPHSDIRGYYRSFAAHRGFSQLVTSFFGAMYQGILPTLFVAYSYFVALSLKRLAFRQYSLALLKFKTLVLFL